MKIFFTLAIVFLTYSNTYSQKSINAQHFTLKCNCSLEENYYNSQNKSYKYSIVDESLGCMYLVLTKEVSTSVDKKQMLDLYKNETPGYKFTNTTFKGFTAIKGKGKETLNGMQFKTYIINFFSDKVFYTITIYAFSDEDLEKAYKVFVNKINLK